ncbi:hypothetical protein WJX73_008100 [Symbiochloris irregularis]|uniref:NF-X1-type domain-containing protein n=1 Tax=Symbiochloris irregularis TaxID=706552 RepID=A0AAW1PZB3_9CHLO
MQTPAATAPCKDCGPVPVARLSSEVRGALPPWPLPLHLPGHGCQGLRLWPPGARGALLRERQVPDKVCQHAQLPAPPLQEALLRGRLPPVRPALQSPPQVRQPPLPGPLPPRSMPALPSDSHSHLQPHTCHYGPCPSCELKCGQQLACGHSCTDGCHDPRPPTIAAFAKPAPPPANALTSPTKPGDRVAGAAASAPAVQQAVKAAEQHAEVAAPCRPCAVPVEVGCVGGHIREQRPCSSSQPFSCSSACDRSLPCGNHTCSLPCHGPSDNTAHGTPSGGLWRACEACTRSCERALPCGHACPLPCHTGSCASCSVPLAKPCHCGRTTVDLLCQEQGTAEDSGRLSCGRPCHRMLPACGHLCQQPCHRGACPEPCQETVTVRCDCRRLRSKLPCHEARARLAAAGRGDTLDPSAAARVLACDEECARLKGTQQRRAHDKASSGRDEQSDTEALSPPKPHGPAQESQPVLSRAEKRRMQKGAREQQQELAQKRKRRDRVLWWLRQGGFWFVFVVVSVVLATYFAQALRVFLKM